MAKNILKYAVGAIAIVAVAIGLLFLIDYIRYRTSPEYRALQALKDLERQYAEDPYGGATPEETLQLFIDALKKGDIELASKYFLIEDQQKEFSYLQDIKSKGELGRTVEEGKKLILDKKTDDKAYFIIANDKNIVEVQVILGKIPNGRWKILEL